MEPHRERPPWLVLADEFSWQGWRFEGATRILPPVRLGSFGGVRRALRQPRNTLATALGAAARNRIWQQLLAGTGLDGVEFVLIESAWEHFAGHEDLTSVPIALAQVCRRHGVPTVYWNKEDPVHFERFLPVALQCDMILTTDSDCVDRYVAAGFKGAVGTMVFPVQPRLHRPYLDKSPGKSVFFAGTYRAHHPDRVRSYHTMIVPALDFGLHIFSRRGQWPEECTEHIVGSYPYLELIQRYSAYRIGLNISSVQDSPTMFPRRIVEMPMADVFVISDRSRALSELFPEVPQSGSPEQTKALLTHFLQNEAERTAILSQTKEAILRNHTYACELARIRDMVRDVRL